MPSENTRVMTTLLHASGSAEFLRMVPALAGFTPRRSIVLLPFHGSRTHGAMRLDLPDPTIDPEEYADIAIGMVSRVDAADAVAIVVYADDDPQPTRDGLVLPLSITVAELTACAQDAGLRLVDALLVTPEGWTSYLDDDPRLTPLDTIATVPDVPLIGDVSGDQHSGADLPTADLATKERVGRALVDIGRILDHEERGHLTGAENPQAIAALVVLEDLPDFFETLLDSPESQPPFVTAALLWCLDRPAFRDVALTQWASDLSGGDRTLSAQYAFAELGASMPDEVGDLFLGRGPSPDPERLLLALSVVRLAAARAPRTLRRGPLTLAAWLSWALGRSTHAAAYLDLVREIDPEYGLASLLRTMIGGGLLPEWAFRRGRGRRA